ncbi:MAG: UDP-N-acetylmuramate--alanine ligase [Sutterellaceae bacterium]|nr:UDP-N-acetylmuramate--alanine ligase [Burkholderiaceae bacterium]MCX7901223.1 UDP-N-acetylmuramate--alanine ligase [Burkholderiaceae bacterium]MDW8429614.1 UDP-N-acetylmuramate--alanine ligase [Sutterellaceae bacterium]
MARRLPPRHAEDVTAEIAVAAARLIAEEGLDYAAAKRRAARQLLGSTDARGLLPDNEQIENELRRHLRLYRGAAHVALLTTLRRTALAWMQRLAAFDPHLVGAVLNGTATEHSAIQLHLFTDDAKAVEIFLLNEGITFEAEEGGNEAGAPLERLHFPITVRPPGQSPLHTTVVLSVHRSEAIRVAPRHRSTDTSLHPVAASGRARAAQLASLIAAESAMP